MFLTKSTIWLCGGFVRFHLGCSDLHFPKFSFLVCSWLGLNKRDILGWHIDGDVMQIPFCSSQVLSLICWLTRLGWCRDEPATTCASPETSFHYSNSQASCVCLTVKKGLGSYRTSMQVRPDGFQPLLLGSSLCLWIPAGSCWNSLYIHLLFLIVYPVDFKFQHETQRQQP